MTAVKSLGLRDLFVVHSVLAVTTRIFGGDFVLSPNLACRDEEAAEVTH